MVDPELHDLLPLFVAEARGRVERLAELARRSTADQTVTAGILRELHTLKGAGRMMGLDGLARLCHAAEERLAGTPPAEGRLLIQVVDMLARLIEQAERGEDVQAPAGLLAELAGTDGPGADADTPGPSPTEGATPTTQDIRVPGHLLDSLAEGATRQRIRILAGERLTDRLVELASNAEAAARGPDPGESLLALAATARVLAGDLEERLIQLRNGADEQLDGLLSLQLQPLQGLFLALARHARELGHRLGKMVEVVLEGTDTTLDRRIVRDLEEVLVHLVRNAVDHGIETSDARSAEGKPPVGTVRLRAFPAGDRVRLSVSDDGAGIETVRIVEKALEAGLLERDQAATTTREELLRLLVTPGFSLAAGVSEFSGRGIGLDVVAEVAGRNGGEISIESAPGLGTTVTVTVPAARRGERVLLVRVGRLRLGVPAAVIRRATRLDPSQIVEREHRVLARDGSHLVPFVHLGRALGEETGGSLLLHGEVAGQPLALLVDAVEREEEVLLRTPGAAGRLHPLVEGVAVAADGRPLPVLSPAALGTIPWASRPAPASPSSPRRLRVLLVDDSLVTREMVRRLLEDGGLDVAVAADAGEALDLLGREEFACVVTDLEMPGMDGLALTRQLRANSRLSHLPVVILTTRDRPADRLRGLEAGADAYLTKQGLNASELLGVVRRLGAS